MDQKVSRRSLLTLLGGTGIAVALNFLYPGISTAIETGMKSTSLIPGIDVLEMNGPDPTYAGGKVVSKSPDGIVLKSSAGVRGVRVPVETVVWKEFDVTPEVIELGDWVDVKGRPLDDGTLVANSGWTFVNIGRLDGSVDQLPVTNDSLMVTTKRGQTSIELSEKLEVISALDGSALSGHIAALTPGMEMGAVGLRLPNGGFRATRIWVY